MSTSTESDSSLELEAITPPPQSPGPRTPPHILKPIDPDTPISKEKLSTVAAETIVKKPLNESRKLQAMEMAQTLAYRDPEIILDLMVWEANKLGPALHPISDEQLKAAKPANITAHTFTQREGAKYYEDICQFISSALDLGANARGLGPDNPERVVIRDTSSHPSKSKGKRRAGERSKNSPLKPDFCLYRQRYKDQYSIGSKTWKGRAMWDTALSLVESKIQRNSRPFTDIDTNKGHSKNKLAEAARGQFASYLGTLREQQPRSFTLAVQIWRNIAYLVRLDQTGIIMSYGIDLNTSPEVLMRFYYYLGQMTDAQLGFDPTMIRATETEIKLWKHHVDALDSNDPDLKGLKAKLEEITKKSSDADYYRMLVNADDETVAEARWNAKLETPPAAPTVDTLPQITYREFLVGRSSTGHTSLTGRGMKGYIALDLTSKEFVFIKDSWRTDYSVDGTVPNGSPRPELVTYAELRRKGVSNIATVICGGDVYQEGFQRPQRTLTQRYFSVSDESEERRDEEEMVVDDDGNGDEGNDDEDEDEDDGVEDNGDEGDLEEDDEEDDEEDETEDEEGEDKKKPIVFWPGRARIHSRIVIKEVGMRLSEYKNSQELVKILLDALVAHKEAWENAGILHRDLSTGNIVIYRSKGLLIDWDLSKPKKQLGKGARDHERSGTWIFLSGLALSEPKKPYDFTDDLESFFHIVTWLFLRFHYHTLGPDGLVDYLHNFYFSSYRTTEGTVLGGTWKCELIPSGLRTLKRKGLDDGRNSPAFSELIIALGTKFQEFYLANGSNCIPSKDDGKEEPQFILTHDKIIVIFDEALQSTEWIADDKGMDRFKNLPEVRGIVTTSGILNSKLGRGAVGNVTFSSHGSKRSGTEMHGTRPARSRPTKHLRRSKKSTQSKPPVQSKPDRSSKRPRTN